MNTTELHASPDIDETIFFDDFTGVELDRSKWNVAITGEVTNHEQQAYIDSAETIYLIPGDSENANGALVLHPRWRPGTRTPEGRRFDFVSGRIHTRGKMEFTYGSIAARIRLSAGVGLWPAFWALGLGAWPVCGEIDIMENVGEPDWASAAVHGPGYSGDAALVNNRYFPPQNDATAWHVYAVDWTPADGLLFKFDGELMYRVTRPMVEAFGPWAYDDPKFLLLNFALGGGYPFKINGVRQPYFGLPETTAQSIRRDEIRMLVDWVRVTKWIPS
nr:glycoside hydrolase family 16 [uncultured bacterium]QCO92813.1 glycoside hydrolase family 16 [uncultured bacterium]QCO92865.1 glycoside hydrolase family 16 [uncultured bacterium]QCO92904.1 glycoside hydrolase family 16 [uncultured bacterium]QCO92932.1 glycoside hydrolase family 16 [uncultured bacterium]